MTILDFNDVKEFLNSLSLGNVIEIRPCTFGQSNPTFELNFENGEKKILRMAPNLDPRKIPRGAHNVSREYFVQKGLGQVSTVPVPKMIYLSQRSKDKAGDRISPVSDFYLMEFVTGTVFKDPLLPSIPSIDTKFQIYRNAVEALALLHSVPVQKISPYIHDSQTARTLTSSQALLKNLQIIEKVIKYQESVSPKVPKLSALPEIMDWLRRELPLHDEVEFCKVCLVHGDYKLDNMIFRNQDFSVGAIIDWELCSLGHPITDLAHFCLGFYVPDEMTFFDKAGKLQKTKFNIPGILHWSLKDVKSIPRVETICTWYCEKMGLNNIPKWNAFIALEFLKILMIFQGIAMRQILGQAVSKNASVYVSLIPATNRLLLKEFVQNESKASKL